MNTRKPLLSALLAAAAAVPVSVSFSPTAQAQPDCRPIVIGVGGLGEQRSTTPTLMDNHLAQAAAEGNRVQKVDYSSSMWPINGNLTLDESVNEGERATTAAVQAYRAECPGGHVTIEGHSEGALVAGNVQNQGDKVVLYSDPRRTGGIFDLLPGIIPGISSPGPRELEPQTTSVCHGNDIICDASIDPLHVVQGIAGYAFNGRHGYAYGEEGDRTGDVFIPTPPPVVELPQDLGIPRFDPPTLPLPEWEPGPLPVLPDVSRYTPTPISAYVPVEVARVLPPEVLNFVPPPLPTFELPRFL